MFNDLVSCRILKLITQYFRESDIDYTDILSKYSYTEDFIEDYYNWCALDFFYELAKLVPISIDDLLSKYFSADVFGADMSAVLRALGNAKPVFNHTDSLINSFISQNILKTKQINDNLVEFIYIQTNESIEKLAEYIVYLLAHIPLLWGAKRFIVYKEGEKFYLENTNSPTLFKTRESMSEYSPKLINEIIQSLQQSRLAIESKNRELEKKNQELNLAYKKLKEKTQKQILNEKIRNLGLLATGIAHEINNPLGSVISNVEYSSSLLKNIDTTDSTVIQELLEVQKDIKDALYRIKNLVGDVNLLAHSGGGEKTPSNIEDLVNSSLRLLTHRLKDIEIKTSFNTKSKTLCSAPRITQVVLNILTNAIHAIRSHGIETGIIEIITNEETDHICLEILNNGGPVPENLLPKLSEPFFTTKEPGTGVGLGLAIVKQILDNHDASIKFQNKANKFSVSILFKKIIEQDLRI